MIEYKRNLPHILPDDGIFFITFRVNNSMPLNILIKLKSSYESDINLAKQIIKRSSLLRSKLNEIYDQYFFDFDSMLDNYIDNFSLTDNEKIAKIISDSMRYLHQKDYELICYCIMPNHIHLIIYQLRKPLFNIMKSLKGYTSREINKVLNRKGKFWHAESYDNVIRSRNELQTKIKYVLNNPLKAGLVNSRENWEYSYCNPKFLEE